MIETLKPYPLITQAIRSDDLAAVKDLFARFPEMQCLKVPGFGSWLHYAAGQGALRIVQYLIEHGASLDSGDPDGRTPLSHAAAKGRAEIVRYLLSSGASFDVSDSLKNPLFGAVLGRSYDVVRILLEAGISTAPSYRFSTATSAELDAVGFAMMQGEVEIAHLIALHQFGGDDALARQAMTRGLAVAEQISS